MEINANTTFAELCDSEECYGDSIITRLRSDPVIMNAVLDSFAEDICGNLVEGFQRHMFTDEYARALMKLMRLGDVIHAEFAAAQFSQYTEQDDED